MEPSKTKVSLKDLLNERGLQLLTEASPPKKEAKELPEQSGSLPLKKRPGPCPNCDPQFGYAYIRGKCYCY